MCSGSNVRQGGGALVTDQYGIGILAMSQNLPFDINGVDLSAFHCIGSDVGTMRYQVAAYHQFVDHTAGLDAERFGWKEHVDSLDQSIAHRPMGGDAFINNDGADRLAHLDADGAVAERLDGVETDAPDSAVVLTESPRSQAMGDDLLLRHEVIDGPEIDKADPARAIRDARRMHKPVLYRPPSIQDHVVDAVGDDFPEMLDQFGFYAIDDEYAGSDDVGGTVRQHAV
jgi:hypothetical protein